MQPLITKASGDQELFSPEKLAQSLKNAGATDNIIDFIENQIQMHEGMTTREIYRTAFTLLRRQNHAFAARYSLKKAIMELGPTGYPFEQFVGQLLANSGYEVLVGQVVQGQCVTHEVDVIASQNHTQCLVECKFFNSQGKFANVKVPLYIRSRVDDIVAYREKLPEYGQTRFQGWVVTNTRFTEDALTYGRCAGLHMVSWDYPKKHSLKVMIENHGLFPITALTGLNHKNKQHLLSRGIVLCHQLYQNIHELEPLGITKGHYRKVRMELDDLCAF
jgi:hypothetical protein